VFALRPLTTAVCVSAEVVTGTLMRVRSAAESPTFTTAVVFAPGVCQIRFAAAAVVVPSNPTIVHNAGGGVTEPEPPVLVPVSVLVSVVVSVVVAELEPEPVPVAVPVLVAVLELEPVLVPAPPNSAAVTTEITEELWDWPSLSEETAWK
jgi:hypothetical protein